MVRQKSKPYRSAKFMRFCHEHMKPSPCALCKMEPWVQLHHFGGNGGTGMKPSDLQLVRVCRRCATKNEVKQRAMIRDGKWELLADMQADALILNEEWIKHLESSQKKGRCSRCSICDYLDGESCAAELVHVEPPTDCARAEMLEYLAMGGPGDAPDEELKYLLEWSNRRSSNVIGFMLEPMKEIATMGGDAGFVATQALRLAGITGENDGEN